MGFRKERQRGYGADESAKIVLTGKYGFRRGMKKVKAKPNTSNNTMKGGDACPTPDQLRGSVEAYQDLDLNSLPELD